jgi:hypothetical protein
MAGRLAPASKVAGGHTIPFLNWQTTPKYTSKIVLKVGFLERDFERNHLAEKSNRTKMSQKIHCARMRNLSKAIESDSKVPWDLKIIFDVNVCRCCKLK